MKLQELWWNRELKEHPGSGCVIMRPGRTLQETDCRSDEAVLEMYHELVRYRMMLSRAKYIYFTNDRDICNLHEAGYVHRDIRRRNILKFGKKCRLIDYGQAAKKGCKTIKRREDSMFRRAGPRISRMKDGSLLLMHRTCFITWSLGAEFLWEATDDHEMLFRTLVELRTGVYYPKNRDHA